MEVTEKWVDIDGFNNVYQVSNIGRVRSKTHYCKGRKGSGKQTGRVLKLQKMKKGYLQVSLSCDSKKFNTSPHRLVAKAFIPNPLNKPQVNHINGIKDDNRVENLEWCTNKDNQIHAIKSKLIKHNKGENHHNSKLTNKEVLIAREMHSKGFKVKDIASKYNVSNTAMSNILRKLTYINI